MVNELCLIEYLIAISLIYLKKSVVRLPRYDDISTIKVCNKDLYFLENYQNSHDFFRYNKVKLIYIRVIIELSLMQAQCRDCKTYVGLVIGGIDKCQVGDEPRR
jgi:hypothetical protein